VLNSAERQALGFVISALNDAVRDAIDDAHHALSRTQLELVDADSYFTGHGAARAAGALIEFERGRPIIVDRPLYHELVKTAIKRTHDELEAKTAAAAKDKKTARSPSSPRTRSHGETITASGRRLGQPLDKAREGPWARLGRSGVRRRHLQKPKSRALAALSAADARFAQPPFATGRRRL
jgi:hypothetical protein